MTKTPASLRSDPRPLCSTTLAGLLRNHWPNSAEYAPSGEFPWAAFAGACAVGAASGVAVEFGFGQMSGRKPTPSEVGSAAVSGCAGGMAGLGLGKVLEGILSKALNTAANNAADSLRLAKALASRSQAGEMGKVMAGPGSRSTFRDAARVAQEYGGTLLIGLRKQVPLILQGTESDLKRIGLKTSVQGCV